MIITALTYSWPRQAKYSCHPETYKGNAIEDYSVELANIPPGLGDARTWEGYAWHVAHIESYDGPAEHECYRVVLTLDGVNPEIKPWADQSMYLIVSASEISMGWPASPKGIPQAGDQDDRHPGWEIVEVYDFQGGLKRHFSNIRVCWCAPVRQPVSLPTREELAVGVGVGLGRG